MRLWPAAYGIFCVLPVVLAGYAVVRGSPVPAPLLLGPAAAITVMSLLYLRVTRCLSPPQRARTLGLECWGSSWAYVIAAVAGGWIARLWDGAPWLERYQFWLALALCAQEFVDFGRLPGWLPTWARVVTDKGLLAFLVGLFHADPTFAVFAALMVGFSLPLQLMGAAGIRAPSAMPRRLDAQRFFNGGDDYRAVVVRTWSDTALRRRRNRVAVLAYRLVRGPWLRPRELDHRRFAEGSRQYRYDRRRERLEAWGSLPPDLSLVHSLCYEADLAAQMLRQEASLEAIHPTTARTGEAAFAWLDAAEMLVGLAELRHPRPDGRRERAIGLARADIAYIRGDINSLLGRKEDAAAGYGEARRLRLRCGLVNLAAEDMAQNAAAVRGALNFQVLLPERVLDELIPMLDEPGLLPLTRRLLLSGAAVCHEALGEPEAARKARRAARALPLRRRDAWRLGREARRAGILPQGVRRTMDLAAMYEWQDGALGGPADQDYYALDLNGAHLPPLILARYYTNAAAKGLTEAGMRLWTAGRYAEAAGLIRQAADLLEREDQAVYAYGTLLDLGSALRRIDAAAAYGDLSRALVLQQRLRGTVRDADLRATSGAATERLASLMIGLLAAAGPDPGEGWPEHRAATAFELSETARSRVLLELMGDPAGGTAGGEPMSYAELRAFLGAEERRARRGGKRGPLRGRTP